jgi:hypothetical protein
VWPLYLEESRLNCYVLQFSRVLVVALPERSDKKDAISMAASLTGIKFDWVDGVNGELVQQKAIPQVCKAISLCEREYLYLLHT